MSTDVGGDWMDLALEDLEGRKAKIEAMIANIQEMRTQGAKAPGPGARQVNTK